jgi:hypothetical protein
MYGVRSDHSGAGICDWIIKTEAAQLFKQISKKNSTNVFTREYFAFTGATHKM